MINGHKIWTSYSDVADWCFLLARTDPDVPKHKGLSAFAVPMHQPGIEQRPLRMINGITNEFGQVLFDGARVPAENMIGEPGEGWRLAMTIVSHEREPGELGYVARYAKTVKELEHDGARRSRRVPQRPARGGRVGVRAGGDAAAARVPPALRAPRRRRPRARRLDRQAADDVGRADGRAPRRSPCRDRSAVVDADDVALKMYLYSRAQSVMGGTSQIQKNIIATRILGLPTA